MFTSEVLPAPDEPNSPVTRPSAANVTSTVKVYCGGSLVATQVNVIPYDALWVVGTLQFQNLTQCTYTSMGTGTVYTSFTP